MRPRSVQGHGSLITGPNWLSASNSNSALFIIRTISVEANASCRFLSYFVRTASFLSAFLICPNAIFIPTSLRGIILVTTTRSSGKISSKVEPSYHYDCLTPRYEY